MASLHQVENASRTEHSPEEQTLNEPSRPQTKKRRLALKQNWQYVALALEWAICMTNGKVPYEEAARVCGVTAQTLKSNLSRARQKMQEAFQDVPPPLAHNDKERKAQRKDVIRLTKEMENEAAVEARIKELANRGLNKGKKGGPRRSQRSRKKPERLPEILSDGDEEYWSVAGDSEDERPKKVPKRHCKTQEELPMKQSMAKGELPTHQNMVEEGLLTRQSMTEAEAPKYQSLAEVEAPEYQNMINEEPLTHQGIIGESPRCSNWLEAEDFGGSKSQSKDRKEVPSVNEMLVPTAYQMEQDGLSDINYSVFEDAISPEDYIDPLHEEIMLAGVIE